MRKLAIWLSWADFLEYHTGQMARAVADRYRSTTTYLPMDWDEFDVLFSVPGPNQEAGCTHKMVKVAWERLELSWASRAAMMAVSCTPTLEMARSKGMDPVLLRWGVNPKHFKPSPLPGGRDVVVGWSGRHKNPRKRYPEVKATFDDVPGITFHPSLSWMEAGRQAGKYTLPAIADDYYAYIDVLVCGSVYEGHSFPMLEAAACGRPIVTFDVGIARDLKDSGAGVVIVDNFEQMKEAVLTADLKTLGEKSAEAVGRYWTWDAVRDDWLEVLDGVGN